MRIISPRSTEPFYCLGFQTRTSIRVRPVTCSKNRARSMTSKGVALWGGRPLLRWRAQSHPLGTRTWRPVLHQTNLHKISGDYLFTPVTRNLVFVCACVRMRTCARACVLVRIRVRICWCMCETVFLKFIILRKKEIFFCELSHFLTLWPEIWKNLLPPPPPPPAPPPKK